MAEWVGSTAAEASGPTAFRLLRELPPKATERTGKLHNEELEDAARREWATG